MKKLLVIGGASADTLHLKDQTVQCAGGAGMYTAMAAHRCGVQVAMFSPRPDPCPDFLLPVAGRLTAWLGPVVLPEELPHFEIDYRGKKTIFIEASLEAEAALSPAMMPADLSPYDHIHLVPLGDAEIQLAFLRACRRRGAKQISAGTAMIIIEKQPQTVRAIIEESDIFFMNSFEVEALYGSPEAAGCEPGKVRYITQGERGAIVVQGDTTTTVPATPATEIDPTGAGDTFCGATIAFLLRNEQPIMAARRAMPLAAEMIAHVGPSALLNDDPPPDPPLDPRIQVNQQRVALVAEQIASLSDVTPFPFISPLLPPAGHPQTLDYFFAVTAQQFSFWTAQNNHYHRPLIARIDDLELKGSDYFFYAYWRRLARNPDFCSPRRQATLSREELLDIFRADNGDDPMPALDLHLREAHRYGRDMLALGLTPQLALQKALDAPVPLFALLKLLDQIGGYKEDPLRKKSGLLALILSQRPEQFLPLPAGPEVDPVIDYHLMRSCLRVGLIDVLDPELHRKLAGRQIVSPADEWAVRYGAYRVIEQVVARSGKSAGAVDYYFFGARSRCPEMSEPECWHCQLDPVCAHRKGLFQPVLRTTFY